MNSHRALAPFVFLLSLSLSLCGPVFAGLIVSDEDRSRFVERLYDKAEPGLRTPDEYIAIAKKAAHTMYGSSVMFIHFSDGVVTYRTYRNAPKTDREIICVSFVYRESLGGHGFISGGGVYSVNETARPVLLVLMRRDLSKSYVNLVHFKPG